jgi:hypothetical protein
MELSQAVKRIRDGEQALRMLDTVIKIYQGEA